MLRKRVTVNSNSYSPKPSPNCTIGVADVASRREADLPTFFQRYVIALPPAPADFEPFNWISTVKAVKSGPASAVGPPVPVPAPGTASPRKVSVPELVGANRTPTPGTVKVVLLNVAAPFVPCV